MKGLWTAVGIVALLLALALGSQVPGALVVCAEQNGRVIDQATGEGIADAFVISTASFHVQRLHGSKHENLYRTVVKTDAHGNFVLPSHWGAFRLGTPGFNPQVRWSITVFRPAYISVSDRAWLVSDKRARAPWPPSVDATPATRWNATSFTLETTTLTRFDMSFAEAAVYYSDITWHDYDVRQGHTAAEVELRHAGNLFFLPQVCGQRADTRIEGGLMMAQFVDNYGQFVPTLQREDPYLSLTSTDSSRQAPIAQNLCELMKAGWDNHAQ